MDPYDTDADLLAQAMAGGIPTQTALLQNKLRRAQMLAGTPMPQGRQVGQAFVASSPLEHLAAAMSRYVGARDARAAEADFAPIVQQQQQAGLAGARIQRADKERGFRIQEGGLQRQIRADEAAAADRAARLELDRGARATADAQAMAREADAARDAKYQQDMLGLRRSEIASTREEKEAAKAEKAAAAKGKAAEDLRKEFIGQQTYKDTQNVVTNYEKVVSAPETGAGDMSLIFGYMKLLDPGSTVREGEYATAEKAGNIPDKVISVYNKALSGEKLAPEVRRQFREAALKAVQAQASRYESTAVPYRRLAEQAGARPEDVIIDVGIGKYLAPPPAPSASAVPVRVKSKAERDALPAGAQYVGPDGVTYTKR